MEDFRIAEVIITKIKAFKMVQVQEAAPNGDGAVKTTTTKIKLYYRTCVFVVIYAIPCTAVRTSFAPGLELCICIWMA